MDPSHSRVPDSRSCVCGSADQKGRFRPPPGDAWTLFATWGYWATKANLEILPTGDRNSSCVQRAYQPRAQMGAGGWSGLIWPTSITDAHNADRPAHTGSQIIFHI